MEEEHLEEILERILKEQRQIDDMFESGIADELKKDIDAFLVELANKYELSNGLVRTFAWSILF